MLKKNKGITLVALVITIIVLLILAVVAIGAVRDSGIIGHAQNSADRYNSAKLEEETMLGQYEDEISKYETEGSFGTSGDGSGELIPGEDEIVWAYYKDEDDEDDNDYLIFMGNVQELRIDANAEVKAIEYIVTSTELSEDGRNEIKKFGPSGVVTKKMGEVYHINIWDNQVLGENKDSVVEKLIIGKNATNIIVDATDTFGSNVKSVEYEEGIEEIRYAHFNLTSLSSIKFPATLKIIGSDAFDECLGLKTITIPASVTTIGSSAFSGCTGLETIYYEGTKAQWESNQLANTFNKYDNPNLKKVIFSDGTEAPVYSE